MYLYSAVDVVSEGEEGVGAERHALQPGHPLTPLSLQTQAQHVMDNHIYYVSTTVV